VSITEDNFTTRVYRWKRYSLLCICYHSAEKHIVGRLQNIWYQCVCNIDGWF